MRLATLPPDRLSPEQKALYERNCEQITKSFGSFKTTNDDGSLLGPWGVFLYEPAVGQAHYDQIAAITSLGHLSEAVKQVAILVVGAHYQAAYELYAHAATAVSKGMSGGKVATICAGQRPINLSAEEAVAYDVASALVGGGVLPGSCYAGALEIFGEAGVIELVLWISAYAQVCVVLNAFDVPSEQQFATATAAAR